MVDFIAIEPDFAVRQSDVRNLSSAGESCGTTTRISQELVEFYRLEEFGFHNPSVGFENRYSRV